MRKDKSRPVSVYKDIVRNLGPGDIHCQSAVQIRHQRSVTSIIPSADADGQFPCRIILTQSQGIDGIAYDDLRQDSFQHILFPIYNSLHNDTDGITGLLKDMYKPRDILTVRNIRTYHDILTAHLITGRHPGLRKQR